MASFLRMSGLSQTVKCYGSPLMKKLHPEREDSDAAREGTACHWMQEESFQTGTEPAELVGRVAPNDVELTREMASAVAIFQSDLLKVGDAKDILIERKVIARPVHAELDGTLDAAHIKTVGPRFKVTIWDFKYGRRYVSAFENYQLIGYGIGLVSDRPKIDPSLVDFDFRIVQPRCPERGEIIRNWEVSYDQIRAHINDMEYACIMASTVNPDLMTGPHCTDCSAIGRCPAAQRATWNAIDVIARWQDPEEPTIDSMSSRLRTLERAQMMISDSHDAAREDVEYALREGKRVPHYILKGGTSNREWTTKDAVGIGAQLGYDLKKPVATCTPAEAERRGVDSDFIKTFTARKPTKMRVVYDDNKQSKEDLSK